MSKTRQWIEQKYFRKIEIASDSDYTKTKDTIASAFRRPDEVLVQGKVVSSIEDHFHEHLESAASIEFVNCVIESLEIVRKTIHINLSFKNCLIKNLLLMDTTFEKTFAIERCDVKSQDLQFIMGCNFKQDFYIDRSRLPCHLSLGNCTFAKIRIENTCIRSLMVTDCECHGWFSLQTCLIGSGVFGLVGSPHSSFHFNNTIFASLGQFDGRFQVDSEVSAEGTVWAGTFIGNFSQFTFGRSFYGHRAKLIALDTAKHIVRRQDWLRWSTIHRRPASRWLRTGRWTQSVLYACWDYAKWLGWDRVRSVGNLSLLRRVSLASLVLIPILASIWPAMSTAIEWLPDPVPPGSVVTLSDSLALIFLASVCVTVGIFLYEVFAPAQVQRYSSDDFVDDIVKRYPEGSPERDDGLRRSIDSLTTRAYRRGEPSHHGVFLRHHGEMIWVPDRRGMRTAFNATASQEKQNLQSIASSSDSSEVVTETGEQAGRRAIPGDERARIVIEEGARAEYQLLATQRRLVAHLAFVAFVSGVAILGYVLALQIGVVSRAAGW